ncbi:MFS transporter [Streptomyces sp. Z26]|uniref:MFS transporter n=1 Tax=Streptomyces sp. Z26 TaxID=2500177 RepID=UPI000EF167FE|nr:MFS transporter [Streptomyces sp. Z26]RLL69867.1 MFS transporter [Streptomyces sp. Z26]
MSPRPPRARRPRPAATPLTATALRVVRLNYGFQLLFNLLWWMPVFYAYQKDAGLSDSQIFGIQSIYYVAFCLFEIPTGLIADRIGTRNCLRAGAVVMTLANLAPVFSASYTGFLVHFLAIAAGRSLTSGAASAYLYDALQAERCGDHYLKAEGTARALGLAAKVLCWPLVGPLMAVAHPAPYVLSALSAAGSLVCVVLLPRLAPQGEPGRTPAPERAGKTDRSAGAGAVRARRGRGTSLREARAALRCIASSPWLTLVMVQGVAVFTLSRICQVNLFQPILLAQGIAESSHGGVLAAMTVAEAVGAARPQWLSRRFTPVTWVSLLSLALAATLAGMTFGGPWAVVALLCLFAAATGFAYPVQRKLVNDAVPADAPRATVLSVESIVDRAVCALAAIGVGAYLSAGRLDALLWHSALATVLLMGAFHLVLRRGTERYGTAAAAAERGPGDVPGEAPERSGSADATAPTDAVRAESRDVRTRAGV